MSLFDAIFSSYSPSLYEYAGEEETVRHVSKTSNQVFTVIVAERVVYERIIDESTVRVETAVLIFNNDSAGGYGGESDPRLDGSYEFDGSIWAVDSDQGEGVQAKTGTTFRVRIRNMRALSHGYQGRDREN